MKNPSYDDGTIFLTPKDWNFPIPIAYGPDRLAEIGSICQRLDISNPLIVTDSGSKDLGFVQTLRDRLKKYLVVSGVFFDISPNPRDDEIENGCEAYRVGGHDAIIAIGGGSGLDVGKAIAFMSGQTLPIWEFEDVGDNWTKANSDKIAPIIAVPTTAGTGSETGRASVILNEETGVKNIIFHPKFLPSIVILDPILTLDLSPRLTAGTGMDALAHNLEALCVPGFHPMADGIAIEGIKLIKKLSLIHI